MPPLSGPNKSTKPLHRTTISRRAKGQIQSRQDYRETCGLLSRAQKERLLKYIDDLTRRGLPPNHQNVRTFAFNISGKWPGKNWASRFIQENKDTITSKYLVGFDLNRKKADNWWLIDHFFTLLQEKWEKYKYAPHNVYNLDEKGFLIGILKKMRRIFTKAWYERGKLQGAAQDGNRTWITLVACVCADGTSLPPALIYPASSGDIQDSWLNDYQPEDDCFFTSSETGWTNNELALDWLIRVFDRVTKPKADHGLSPRLLLLDGHGSHINMDFLEACHKRNIHVAAYPPHTTHRLQPLDASIFAPLVIYYSQELDNWIHRTQGLCKMNKAQFYKLFKPAFIKAILKKNILSGFKQTGLYPLNPSLILDQLSTKQAAPLDGRPSSKGSAISSSDWTKINKVVKDALGEVLGAEGRSVLRLYHDLQAENALLKAENKGLREAVLTEKKRKKPKKALFTELRGEDGNAAIFFLPAKIQEARDLLAQKAKEEEEAQAQKEQDKLQRQQRKEEQAELRRAAAIARQEKREKLAAEKAQKQAEREEAQQQRLVNLQLLNEQGPVAKGRRGRPQKPRPQASSSGNDIKVVDEPVVVAQQMPTLRSGRQLHQP